MRIYVKKPLRTRLLRDADGWEIPGEGSLSRKIYDLRKSGKSAAEISQILAMKRNDVHSRISHMKYPDKYKRASVPRS